MTFVYCVKKVDYTHENKYRKSSRIAKTVIYKTVHTYSIKMYRMIEFNLFAKTQSGGPISNLYI